MGASLTDLWKATKNYLVIEMPSEEHNQRGQNKQKKPEAENFFLELWISFNVAEQADPSAPAGEYFEDAKPICLKPGSSWKSSSYQLGKGEDAVGNSNIGEGDNPVELVKQL